MVSEGGGRVLCAVPGAQIYGFFGSSVTCIDLRRRVVTAVVVGHIHLERHFIILVVSTGVI